MRRFLTVVGLAVLAACSDNGPDGEAFFAYLTGAAAVPPNASSGSGTMTLRYDGGGFDLSVTVQQVVNVTSVRIQAGGPGEIGPVLAEVFDGPPTGTIINATVISSGRLVAADLAVTPDSLATLLRAGAAYANVITSGVPGGELRGQFGPQ
jgi:hypothetical protein